MPIPDQHGRIVVITGANRGLGLELARRLAGAGATVIAAVRNVETGRETLAGLGDRVELHQLDLSSLRSVETFASSLIATRGGVDVLVNNAAVAAIPRQETPDGFEMQMAVDFLCPFALTARLLPSIRDRVVTIGSLMAGLGSIDLDDLQSRRRYTPRRAYGSAKLAALTTFLELDRRLRAAHSPVRSVAAHPRAARTHPNASGRGPTAWAFAKLTNALAKDPEVAVLPFVHAATADVASGTYWGPGNAKSGHDPLPAKVPTRAKDAAMAAKLWTAAEALTGLRMPI